MYHHHPWGVGSSTKSELVPLGLFCSGCYPRGRTMKGKCPTCRAKLRVVRTRCRALEVLVIAVQAPCLWQKNGCTNKFKCPRREERDEKHCSFRDHKCALCDTMLTKAAMCAPTGSRWCLPPASSRLTIRQSPDESQASACSTSSCKKTLMRRSKLL